MTETILKKRDKIRYLLFDLDGTLFADNHRPAPETCDILRQLMDRGYYVGVATGRSLVTLQMHFKPLGLRFNAPSVGCAGAEVADLSDPLKLRYFSAHFPKEELMAVLRYMQSHGLRFANDGTGPLYTSASAGFGTYQHRERQEAAEAGMFYPEVISVPDDRLDMMQDGNVLKLMTWFTTPDQRADLLSWLDRQPGMHAVCPGFDMLEILPAGVDKGVGITKAAAQLGLLPENCCVFGDSGNDTAMLKAAGLAVAMKNASPEALAVADLVTDKTNQQLGAAKMAAKLFL